LSVKNVRVVEGNSGSTNAVFAVTLVPAAKLPVSVSYTTSNGTAQSMLDYEPASGALNFAVGEKRQNW